MDLIAHMDVSGRTGKVTGTIEQLALIARCTVPAFKLALDDLRLTKTAKIAQVNGSVTIINRRMYREYNIRKRTCLRVKKFRSNASVTGQTSEVRDQRSDLSTKTDQAPALEAVKLRAAEIGIASEEAEKFWHHFESTGWIDKNGNHVAKWESKLAGWRAKNGVETRRSLTILDLRNIIESKKSLASQIKTKYCSEVAMGDSWSDKTKQREFFGLKREIRNIETRISKMA